MFRVTFVKARVELTCPACGQQEVLWLENLNWEMAAQELADEMERLLPCTRRGCPNQHRLASAPAQNGFTTPAEGLSPTRLNRLIHDRRQPLLAAYTIGEKRHDGRVFYFRRRRGVLQGKPVHGRRWGTIVSVDVPEAVRMKDEG